LTELSLSRGDVSSGAVEALEEIEHLFGVDLMRPARIQRTAAHGAIEPLRGFPSMFINSTRRK
jgi:hypothetical protein